MPKHNLTFNFRLSPELKALIQDMAKHYGLGEAALMRFVLTKFSKEYKKEINKNFNEKKQTD